MLGKRSGQGGLFTAGTQLGAGVVGDLGFYGKLAGSAGALFRDEEFAGAYCLDNGRPSVAPSILVVARLLQVYTGVSDGEVVERCKYDLRWKVALNLELASVRAPFAKSTFQAFRARLTLHAREGQVFEQSVRAARAAGLFPKRLRVALDSTPVRGRGAVKDTFNLLSDAIVGVVRAVASRRETTAKRVAREAGVERHLEAASLKGSEVVDWTDRVAVSEFLGRLLEECERVVRVAEGSGCASEEVGLLKKVIAQDVERTDAAGGARIRDGVSRDRTVSVHDPEMRHGHKSNGKVYSGHKVHLATEVASGVITAVGVSAPAQADGSQVGSLVAQTEWTTGLPVEQALGDGAYSTREAIEEAGAASVELVTKMPRPRKNYYGPAAFQVSEDGQEAICPAGIRSTEVKKRGDGYLHFWSADSCGSCASKPGCTKAARRSLQVRPDFHERRERERYARSAEGRRILKDRVVVEHAIGRVKNRGAGRARYFGRRKTLAQWLWTAAVVNLIQVWTRVAASSSIPVGPGLLAERTHG